jgi:hypothetical protein
MGELNFEGELVDEIETHPRFDKYMRYVAAHKRAICQLDVFRLLPCFIKDSPEMLVHRQARNVLK